MRPDGRTARLGGHGRYYGSGALYLRHRQPGGRNGSRSSAHWPLRRQRSSHTGGEERSRDVPPARGRPSERGPAAIPYRASPIGPDHTALFLHRHDHRHHPRNGRLHRRVHRLWGGQAGLQNSRGVRQGLLRRGGGVRGGKQLCGGRGPHTHSHPRHSGRGERGYLHEGLHRPGASARADALPGARIHHLCDFHPFTSGEPHHARPGMASHGFVRPPGHDPQGHSVSGSSPLLRRGIVRLPQRLG